MNEAAMQNCKFTAADDRFHFSTMSDRWWETETCWFSFCVPERQLGGWVYILARPNIGTVCGGAWFWDDTGELPWEVLHCANYTAMRLPRDQDLDDIRLPTGVSVRALEPLTRYDVGYRYEDRVHLSMHFNAVMPALPLTNVKTAFAHLSHFDQIGHVTGELVLDGERIAIDCYAMRDRSWGPRPEHRATPAAYVTAMADAGHGLLAVTNPTIAGDPVTHGFLLRDGEARPLVRGHRRVERHPADNRVLAVTIEAEDQLGRTVCAHGTPQSRIIVNRHTYIDSMSLVRWSVNGLEAWGEDQDLWPYERWSQSLRRKRLERHK
jgi:hypothetical protein